MHLAPLCLLLLLAPDEEPAKNPQKSFVIKADQEVPYERFDAVLDALKQSKAKYIYLLSEQRTQEQ